MEKKSNALGSMYINPSKETPEDILPRVTSAIEFLRENGIYFNISVHKDKIQELVPNTKGYVSLTGVRSKFKKTRTDADFFIAPRTENPNAAPPATKAAPTGEDPWG